MKKIYQIGGVFIIVNVILIIFIIFPLINNIKKTSRDLIAQKSELFLLEQKKNNLENLKTAYKVHQKDMEEIETVFINPETPIDFIRFLEAVAADSQALIDVSLAGGGSDFEHSFSFHVSLKSSFPNFLKFLEKLENGPYPIEVSSLNIKRTTEGKVSSTLASFVLAKE